MHARGGFFRNALQVLHRLGQIARAGLDIGLQRALEFDFFLVFRLAHGFAGFEAGAPQREHGGIAAIIEDDVGGNIAPIENMADIIPVIRQALALDGIGRDAGSHHGRSGMILGGEDVAGGPAQFRAQRHQSLHQHRGLDRHVQRAGDARALQRLRRTKFGAQRHQAGHFGFGDGDFATAEFGEAQVLDDIIGHDAIPVDESWSWRSPIGHGLCTQV